MLACLLLAQALSIFEAKAVETLKAGGASVRVEQPLEIWVDFDRPIRDADLAPIRGMQSLTALRILAGNPTAVGLRHVREVPRLWLLVVKSDRLGEAGLDHLATIASLTKLDLMGASVTAKGIDSLGRLPKLRQLYLHGAKIDGRSGRALGKLSLLDVLTLPKSTRPATLAELKRRLPRTRIDVF